MFILLAWVLTLTVVSGTLIRTPANTVYNNGEDVQGYLACEVVPSRDTTIVWFFTEYGTSNTDVFYANGVHNADRYKSKYVISENASSSGNFSLTITNLQRTDSGKYVCQVNGNQYSANITVADPPQVPELIVANSVVENSTARFICKGVGGFPPPTYSWQLKGKTISPGSYAEYVEDEVVTGSTLTMAMEYTHDKSALTCITTNLLSSANATRQLNVEYSPRVSVKEQNLVVLKDESFSLACQVKSNPEYSSLSWRRGSDVIVGQSSTTYMSSSGITSSTSFHCLASNTLGTGQGQARVTVHYAPEVSIDVGSSLVKDEVNPLKINCTVDAEPAASVKWMKGRQIVSATSELSIVSVNRQDAGEYRCVASNTPAPSSGAMSGTQTKEASFTLSVNYGADSPKLTVNPSSSSSFYTAGLRIEFNCSISDYGHPRAEIRWYKSRQTQPLGQTNRILRMDGPQATDSDEYWCTAVNSVTQAKSNVLTINIMDKPVPMTPVSEVKIENITEGTKHHIQCSFRGFPAPAVSWYKNGELLVHGETYKIDSNTGPAIVHPYLVTNSSLTLYNSDQGATSEDGASFTCLASNRAGESEVETQVNVLYAPQYKGFGKAAANLSSSAVINCEVSSYPPVTSITFKISGESIVDDDKYSLSELFYSVGNNVKRQRRELNVHNVQNDDFGLYTCVSVSSQGSTQHTIVLSKTSKPDPPALLQYSNVTWQSVLLSWQPGFNGGYPQTYSVHRMWNSEEKTESVPEHNHTVTGLSPMTKYTFRIFARNTKGISSYVEQVVTTPNLLIPVAELVYDEQAGTLRVDVNVTGYCTKLQGSVDGVAYTDVSECTESLDSIAIKGKTYTSYRALTCVPARLDVCSESIVVTPNLTNEDDKQKTIIIAVVVSVFAVIIIVIVVAAVIVLKRKGRFQKSAAKSTKTGHINPIMTTNGVPGEVHFSNQNGYNINSDLEDEMDALPYGELNNHKENSRPTSQSYQNLDYVYASVQKKPSEQNKLNEAASYQPQTSPTNMNIHDPSASDNSESGGYNELSNPYQGPDVLAEFLGPDVMAFHRLPSLSESGYSTPESKQLKKVVYEVIV